MAASETGPILITGAAGKTGRALLRALRGEPVVVRALVRSPEQGRAAEELGAAEVVVGDLEDRRDLGEAARGVAAIYHICPNVHPRELAIGRSLIAAAEEAGVGRFVFHSVLHPQVEAMPHHWAKLRVEESLFASPLEATILQPAPYMQNLLGQWPAIVGEGVYRVPYALATRVSMVDLEDVAAVAARVLTEPGHAGATYELCAPGLLDQRQIAAVLGERLGRPVRAETLSRDDWAQGASAAGLGRTRIETLRAMFRYYETHGMRGGAQVLEWLLGRPATGFAEWVARQAAELTPRARRGR